MPSPKRRDGYTLLLASGEMAINPHLFPKIPTTRQRSDAAVERRQSRRDDVNTDVPAKTSRN